MSNDCPLDPNQMAVAKHVQQGLSLRKQFYQNHRVTSREYISDSDSNSNSDSDIDVSNDNSTDLTMANPMHTGTIDASDIALHWKKPILMKGKAGSGKSETICQAVKQCIRNNENVLVAVPTGFLTTQFCAMLPDEVACQTVRSAFFTRVNVSEPPCVSWAISHFDIVIIDEIPMISERNFQHILNTLMFRPVLVLGGDNAQQQPFQKSKNVTVNIAHK